VNGLPAAERQASAGVIEEFANGGVIAVFETIGAASLFVALTAAGIALWRRAGAPLAVPILLVLAAIPIAWHVTPFGQVGLALFIAAVLPRRADTLGPSDARCGRASIGCFRRHAGRD
jgi:hypothetical protein